VPAGSGKDKQSIQTQRNIRTLRAWHLTDTDDFIRINARYPKNMHLVAFNKCHSITKQNFLKQYIKFTLNNKLRPGQK
jgi:hypothetical protein